MKVYFVLTEHGSEPGSHRRPRRDCDLPAVAQRSRNPDERLQSKSLGHRTARGKKRRCLGNCRACQVHVLVKHHVLPAKKKTGQDN